MKFSIKVDQIDPNEDDGPMKILVLGHERLRPPQKRIPKDIRLRAPWRTEYDVMMNLRKLGHHTSYVGLDDSIEPLLKEVQFDRPDLVFNLLEEFSGLSVLDQNIVSLLELLKVPFTGCGSRGLAFARDKAVAKILVKAAGVETPEFSLLGVGQSISNFSEGNFSFPVIVKSQIEDSSLGLGRRSVVRNQIQLKGELRRFREAWGGPIIVEKFIEGREFYVGTIAGKRWQVLPPRELCFGNLPSQYPRVATRQIKWNLDFRARNSIFSRTLARSDASLARQLSVRAQVVASALKQDGYSRIDFRMDKSGRLFFLEANPNPQICEHEDFADAAKAIGMNYANLLNHLVDVGRNRGAIDDSYDTGVLPTGPDRTI